MPPSLAPSNGFLQKIEIAQTTSAVIPIQLGGAPGLHSRWSLSAVASAMMFPVRFSVATACG